MSFDGIDFIVSEKIRNVDQGYNLAQGKTHREENI
jgi:hypothetical protein